MASRENPVAGITFLLDAPRSHTAPSFLIRDLPGTSGRLDVVCRVMAAVFRTVPRLAPSLRFLAVLGGPPDPPLLLQAGPASPNVIPESELACALLIKSLLNLHHYSGVGRLSSWPQLSLSRRSFEEALVDLSRRGGQIYYLMEGGTPLEAMELNASHPLVFLLGDHKGMPEEHEDLVKKMGGLETSVGRQSLLGSHVVTLVLLELARRLGLSPHNENRQRTDG